MTALPWFRFYHEFSTDLKVQKMSEAYQRRLVMLFCMKCNGNETLQNEDVTFHLRISNEEWAVTKAEFVRLNFIDEDNNILNWEKRQYKSDSSNSRVKRHREKKKRKCNVTVTPPDTDTDTDTERKNVIVDAREANVDVPEEVPRETATLQLPAPAIPDPQSTFEMGEQIAELTGWKDNPNWFGNYSRITAWLAEGYDFACDILPTVRRVIAGKPPGTTISSLSYFDKPIANAYATRMKPLPEGQSQRAPPAKKSFHLEHQEAAARGIADARKEEIICQT